MAGSKANVAAYVVGIAVLVAVAIVVISALVAERPVEEPQIYGTETTRAGAEFVGSQECIECHQENHDGWLGTLHPYKVREVSAEGVVGDFWNDNTYERNGITMTMFQEDGDFYINTVSPDGEYEDYKIDYTLGGEWKQRYMLEWDDGSLYILPIQWNVATSEWVNYAGAAPDADNYWADRSRLWQVGCGSCHATGLDIGYDSQTDTFDTTWVDGGAGCEACHGPGGNHIESAPGYENYTIINPARLAHTEQKVDVCGQCHTRGSSKALVADHYDIPGAAETFGFPYGYELGKGKVKFHYDMVDPEVDTPRRFWLSGHEASHRQQAVLWTESKHFDSGVTCIDCHTGHGEGGNFRLTKKPGNKLCMDCHSEPEKTNPGIHSIHASGSCVACHMPRTSRSATNLTDYSGDIRSHSFQFLYPQATIDAGGLEYQTNTCNACHYHEDDDPEDLQRVVDKIRQERREAFGMVETSMEDTSGFFGLLDRE